MSPAQFAQKLQEIESDLPHMACRIFPSSFEPNDPSMRAFPYTLEAGWGSCEKALRHFGSRGVMARLPFFWQFESPLSTACRAAGAFLFLNDRGNIPLGIAAVKMAEVDTVITDAEDAHLFSRQMSETGIQAQNWVVIHPAGAAHFSIAQALKAEGVRLFQEVHLFPCVPLLEQCEHLSAEKKPLFHTVAEFCITKTERGLAVSSAAPHPFPLEKYELPETLALQGTCVCGKEVISASL